MTTTIDQEASKPGRSIRDVEMSRLHVSSLLTEEWDHSRYVVTSDVARVEDLLNERYVDYDHDRNRVVRFANRLLARVGLHRPGRPKLVERHGLEESQLARQEVIKLELDSSRKFLSENILWGVDDVEIDSRLGVRTDGSMVPGFLRQLHGRIEQQLGRDVSFMDWMVNHATDEQLLNVWQWHDEYIKKHNESAEFKEQVARVKAGYKDGLTKAIAAGTLDDALESCLSKIDGIEITCGSPFSPVLATAEAYAHGSKVQVRSGLDDRKLYHEITHLIANGFVGMLDEGATELMAVEVYNGSRHSKDHVLADNSVYRDSISFIRSLERITEGRVGLRQISRCSVGSNRSMNTSELVVEVDDMLDAPFVLAIIRYSHEFVISAGAKMDGATMRLVEQSLLKKDIELFESVVLDNNGKRLVSGIEDFVRRVFSPEIVELYDRDEIIALMRIAKDVIELKKALGQDKPIKKG